MSDLTNAFRQHIEALEAAATKAVLAWRNEDDDGLIDAMDALAGLLPGDNTPEIPPEGHSQGGGPLAVFSGGGIPDAVKCPISDWPCYLKKCVGDRRCERG